MITLYYDAISVSSQKVLLVLEELSIPWVGRHINLLEGDQHSEAFRKVNRQGEVPVIVDDGWTMGESAVINEYLTQMAPDQCLLPEEPKLRAEVQQLVFRISSYLQQPCGFLTYALLARPFQLLQPRDKVVSSINATVDPVARRMRLESYLIGIESTEFKHAIAAHLSILDDANQRLATSDWLCGNYYTLADITLLPYVLRLDHLGMMNMVSHYLHVADWYERCTKKPSFKRALVDRIPEVFVSMGREAGSAVQQQVQDLLGKSRDV